MQIGIDIAQKTQVKLESQVHTVAYDLPDQFPHFPEFFRLYANI